MAKKTRSPPMPWPLVFASDLVGLFLTVGPGAVGWAAVVFFLRWAWDSPFLWAFALAAPLLLVVTFLAALFILRLLCPRLKPGRYRTQQIWPMTAWYCQLALSRAAAACGLKDLLHSFYLTRFLYGRALGAKVSYRVNTAQSIILTDYPLLTVGPGATLSEGTFISCHTFLGDKLLVRPVVIGAGVFLGKDCVVNAGTTIGDDAWIGMLNRFQGDTIAPGTKIGNCEWEYGDPAKAKARGFLDKVPNPEGAAADSDPDPELDADAGSSSGSDASVD